ncbi:hypothetical protein SPONL_1168 [uncultured Candidatus Thioglobus sp.]|nr:hypothetical protein SPONL_1168 [uncultured Candidatus Thioglobus sp.]
MKTYIKGADNWTEVGKNHTLTLIILSRQSKAFFLLRVYG